MPVGQGSISVNQKKVTTPVPPFPLNAAENGLSVDPITKRIVLGNDPGAVGDPAQLLSNREMKLQGFYLDYIGQTIEQFFDDGNGLFQLYRNPAGVLSFNVDTVVKQYQLGEDYRIEISQPFQTIKLRSSAEPFLNILGAPAARNLTLGIGSPELFLNDLGANKTATLISDVTVPNSVKFGLEKTSNLAYVRVQNDDFLRIDVGTGLFQIGDINSTVNGSILNIDDTNQKLEFLNNANTYLIADVFGGQMALGDYTNFLEPVFYAQFSTAGNPTGEIYVPTPSGDYVDFSMFHNPTSRSVLDISNGAARYQQRFDINAGVQEEYLIKRPGAPDRIFLHLDWIANTYGIGDLSGAINGTNLVVADVTSSIDITNTAANAFVRINGVPGFTGTVTPVTTITVDGGIVTNVA